MPLAPHSGKKGGFMKKRILALLMAVILTIPGCGGPAKESKTSGEETKEVQTVVSSQKEITPLEKEEKPSGETIYMEIGNTYGNLISAINRTMNSDELTMTYDYQGIAGVTLKKSKSFLEMKMKTEQSEFIMAGEIKEDAKESIRFYVSITAPDENGTVQSIKQMAVMIPDQGESTGDILSDFTISGDDFFGEAKEEDFEVTTEENGDITTYYVKYIGENKEFLNNTDGYYMACEVRDGYVEKIMTLLQDEIESDQEIVPIMFSREKVIFEEYNDASFEEVDQETILWSVFAGIMSLVMGSLEQPEVNEGMEINE